jgi:hypothetical protein
MHCWPLRPPSLFPRVASWIAWPQQSLATSCRGSAARGVPGVPFSPSSASAMLARGMARGPRPSTTAARDSVKRFHRLALTKRSPPLDEAVSPSGEDRLKRSRRIVWQSTQGIRSCGRSPASSNGIAGLVGVNPQRSARNDRPSPRHIRMRLMGSQLCVMNSPLTAFWQSPSPACCCFAPACWHLR